MVSTTQCQTSWISKTPSPRRFSIKSSNVNRIFFIAFWSIFPSRIITWGRPLNRSRSRLHFSPASDTATSNAASVRIGTTAAAIGREESSIGREAMLPIKMVVTISDGCKSPSCRLPIIRTAKITSR